MSAPRLINVSTRRVIEVEGEPCYWVADDGSVSCIDCDEVVTEDWMIHQCAATGENQ